ncbi:hypothetical protein HDZ31DRAFT_62821 [Schizophyllum fasciatum]
MNTNSLPPPLPKENFEDFYYKEFLPRHPHVRRDTDVNGRNIDLHDLHVAVNREGGSERIDARGAWPIIAARLGLADIPATDSEPAKSAPEIAGHIATCYQECLGLFDAQLYRMLSQSRRSGMVVPAPTTQTYVPQPGLASSPSDIPIVAFIHMLHILPYRYEDRAQARVSIEEARIDLLNKDILRVAARNVPVELRPMHIQRINQTYQIACLMNERLPLFFLVVRQWQITLELMSVLLNLFKQCELLMSKRSHFILDSKDLDAILWKMKECADRVINTGKFLYYRYQQARLAAAARGGQRPVPGQRLITSAASAGSTGPIPTPSATATQTTMYSTEFGANTGSSTSASKSLLAPPKPSVLTPPPPLMFAPATEVDPLPTGLELFGGDATRFPSDGPSLAGQGRLMSDEDAAAGEIDVDVDA